MGWSYGIDGNGREVGYGVEAECDFPDCHEKVWRGMSERCGPLDCETDDDGPGCGGFFCSRHLFMAVEEWLCSTCCERWPERVVHVGDDVALVRARVRAREIQQAAEVDVQHVLRTVEGEPGDLLDRIDRLTGSGHVTATPFLPSP
jgi:hypothetical protein